MQRVPYATLALLLVTFTVAFFTLGNQSAGLSWGFVPKPLATQAVFERLLTVLSSTFVHVDPVHLLANMLLLAGAGPAIERATGSLWFFLVYLVSGVVGVFVHWFAAVTAMPAIAPEPLYGASGAVAGLIGYAWLRFYRSRVPVLPGRYIPLWLLVLVWLVLQVAGGVLAVRQFGATVAYWSHLGGFISGFVLAFMLRAHSLAEDEAVAEHLSAAANVGARTSATAAAQVVRARPKDVQALKQLYESSEQLGDETKAKDALHRLIAIDPGFAVAQLSNHGWLRDHPVGERGRIAASVAETSPRAAEMLWQSILEEANSSETPHALFGLISLADPASARIYANKLQSEFALSPQAEEARRKWPELFR